MIPERWSRDRFEKFKILSAKGCYQCNIQDLILWSRKSSAEFIAAQDFTLLMGLMIDFFENLKLRSSNLEGSNQSRIYSYQWILKDDAFVGCLMKQAKIDHAKIVMVGGICDGMIVLYNWLSKLNHPFNFSFGSIFILFLICVGVGVGKIGILIGRER